MWIIFKKTKSAVVICLVASLCFILFAPAASAEEIFDPRDLRTISADDSPWVDGNGSSNRVLARADFFEAFWEVVDIVILGRLQQDIVQSDGAIDLDRQDTDEKQSLRTAD